MDQMDRIENKIDELSDKIDDHLGRISKAEVAIVYLQGHVKLATAIFIAVVGSLVAAYFQL